LFAHRVEERLRSGFRVLGADDLSPGREREFEAHRVSPAEPRVIFDHDLA